MELLSVATGYISAAFAENKKVKEFKDDFIEAFIDWIRPIFLKDDPKLVEALEGNPEDGKTLGRLEARLEGLLEDESFRKDLDTWIKKTDGTYPKEKNILIAEDLSGKNLNVGDKQPNNEHYDRKNIVNIKKGDFLEDVNIGDS